MCICIVKTTYKDKGPTIVSSTSIWRHINNCAFQLPESMWRPLQCKVMFSNIEGNGRGTWILMEKSFQTIDVI